MGASENLAPTAEVTTSVRELSYSYDGMLTILLGSPSSNHSTPSIEQLQRAHLAA